MDESFLQAIATRRRHSSFQFHLDRAASKKYGVIGLLQVNQRSSVVQVCLCLELLVYIMCTTTSAVTSLLSASCLNESKDTLSKIRNRGRSKDGFNLIT
jgi:hypothetical protein